MELFIANELIAEISSIIFEELTKIVDNIAEILEYIHEHCYVEDSLEYYYDSNKCCRCKKVTYKCNCGRRYNETYECYEPPPKEKNKSKVLERNKRKHSNHK